MNRQRSLLILINFILITFGSGQTLKIHHEYKTDPQLLDVLVSVDTNSVSPETFIYQHHFQDYQSTESIINILPGQRTVISEKNRLLGIFQPAELPQSLTEPYPFEFSLYSRAAQLLYSLHDKAVTEDRHPSFFINDEQQAVVQVSANGDCLIFYDNHGNILREKRFMQNVPHNYEFPEVHFSEGGDRLILLTRKFDTESGRMVPMLYMLSPIGEELWQYQLILDRIDALTISKSGKYVAVSGSTHKPLAFQARFQTFVFDTSNYIRNSVPFRATQLLFDPSETSLIISEKQTVKIIDLATDGIYVLKHVGSGQKEIADFCFLNDSSFAISAGAIKYSEGLQIYDNPEILIYSKSGQLIAQQIFRNEYTYRGKLLPSISGEQIGFTLKNRFIVLQLHR